MATPAAEHQQPTAPPPKEEGPRSFGVFLAKLAQGEAESACSYELHELTKRMQDEQQSTGNKVKGALTLKVSLEADEEGLVKASYEVTIKAPKPKRGASHLWFTKGGNLSTTPPKSKQTELPFRDVANERGIPHDLNDGDIEQREV